MVRCIIERMVDGDMRYIVAAGLSGDDKPVENIITGSRFLEVDTGIWSAFDETGKTWYAMSQNDYTYENWTADTGENVTSSDGVDMTFRVGA